MAFKDLSRIISAYINTGIAINSLEFMITHTNPHASTKWDRSTSILITFSLFLSMFIAFAGINNVYAAELFSKDEKPFGVSYDD